MHSESVYNTVPVLISPTDDARKGSQSSRHKRSNKVQYWNMNPVVLAQFKDSQSWDILNNQYFASKLRMFITQTETKVMS